MIPIRREPSAAELIADLDAYLALLRSLAEFEIRFNAAVDDATERGCGVMVIGQPPDATVEASVYVPPFKVFHLPHPEELT